MDFLGGAYDEEHDCELARLAFGDEGDEADMLQQSSIFGDFFGADFMGEDCDPGFAESFLGDPPTPLRVQQQREVAPLRPAGPSLLPLAAGGGANEDVVVPPVSGDPVADDTPRPKRMRLTSKMSPPCAARNEGDVGDLTEEHCGKVQHWITNPDKLARRNMWVSAWTFLQKDQLPAELSYADKRKRGEAAWRTSSVAGKENFWRQRCGQVGPAQEHAARPVRTRTPRKTTTSRKHFLAWASC